MSQKNPSKKFVKTILSKYSSNSVTQKIRQIICQKIHLKICQKIRQKNRQKIHQEIRQNIIALCIIH